MTARVSHPDHPRTPLSQRLRVTPRMKGAASRRWIVHSPLPMSFDLECARQAAPTEASSAGLAGWAYFACSSWSLASDS